ncbi:MAG: hypothetical protein LQ346_005084 [Caloplaca aetnensis]|nr:MAG: hypothetical protein LQ346_005084 [Caloplaca aetnensis]
MSSRSLESVLVVGGCGFLGYEIVRSLTEELSCSVAVLSRTPREPRVDGVSYHTCDITHIDALRALFLQLQPRVVIHSASPLFFQDHIDQAALHRINVNGTRNLLEVATTTKSVRAFVYTSSSAVHARSAGSFLTENAPLVDRSASSDGYSISKALADTMVLHANGPELQTLCLRLPAIYGERDTQLIPGSLAVLRDQKTHIQLGDNSNLYDAIYVGNAASAHLDAAKALLRADATMRVDGEAFFVTDDAAVPFWDFQRKIWAAAGDTTELKEVQVIPAWVGMAMAALVEYLFLIFTLGRVSPPKTLRRSVLRYAIEDRSHCIDKAKERLQYRPLIDTDEGVRRGVAWALQHQQPDQAHKEQ